MGKLRLHHVPIFGYQPLGVSCMAADETEQKLAVARISDHGYLIEIWNMNHWFHEQTLLSVKSVEALLWCDERLFSAGLHSDIVEHDLHTGGIKNSDSAMSGGAIWCMALNKSQKMIAAGTEASSVMLFDIFEGVRFVRSFVKHEGRITSIAWYDPLNVIVTGGLDIIRVWSVNSGNPLQRIMIPRQHRNKETIVWAISVFGVGDEMTIVSGDSTGQTNFWMGPPEQYTECKSLQSHRSDVRAVSIGHDGQSVYAAGVDPVLVRFELADVDPDSSGKHWIMTSRRNQHLNDVNALVCVKSGVISAGLDCKIIINNFDQRKTTTLSAIPQKSLIHMAHEAQCILTQYPTHLELWRLANTEETSDVHGAFLSMSSGKKLLLKLKTKERLILCSTVSRCGEWVVFSDSRTVCLFRFALGEADLGHNDLLTPVAITGCPKQPAHCFTFSPDSKYLVCALRDSTLQLVKLKEQQATVSKSRVLSQGEFGPVYLMSISSSGAFLAVAELCHGVHIFRLKKLKLVATLPKHSGQPTAIDFHPNSDLLIVSYSDRKIVEYDVGSQKTTKWSKMLSKGLHPDWLSRVNIIRRIFYHHRVPDIIFVQDDECFAMIDKRQPLPNKSVKLFQQNPSLNESADSKRHAFHISENKYLIHLDFMKDDSLVAVERSPTDLVESLPPPFKRHKFGV